MFRSTGSVSHIFKKLRATVSGRGRGGGGGRPNVKVELNISLPHPKNVVRVTAHPDNQEMAMRLAAAAHPVRADFFDRLAHFNLVVVTGEFAMKVYRVFVKPKRSGPNKPVKGVVCSFKMDGRLDDLLTESKLDSVKMNYITERIDHVAKQFGFPPPPRPPAPSKEGANGGGAKPNGGGAKATGANGDGAKPNGGGAKPNGANGDGGDQPELVDFFEDFWGGKSW